MIHTYKDLYTSISELEVNRKHKEKCFNLQSERLKY